MRFPFFRKRPEQDLGLTVDRSGDQKANLGDRHERWLELYRKARGPHGNSMTADERKELTALTEIADRYRED